MRSVFALIMASYVVLGMGCAVSADEPPAPISFNRDIRPILSEHCFACHGPDANARQADLRLDERSVALELGAITPGNVAASSLVERIESADTEIVMPPPESNKPLTAEQRQLLKRWIADGAKYETLWSFIPVPDVVPVPTPDDPEQWIRGAIDSFVLTGLTKSPLKISTEASREQWLRRASFDLTGLPPTLAELDRFLADSSPTAYESAVDLLLAAPTFGERMANEWLDVARYADTFGYQADREMHVWPWRDWVIRAFNDNLSYDKFILWQTAGDLLPEPTRDQQLATAFNRLHRQTNEGGSIEEEFRTAYIADRVVTNGTAFLGLTFECARCHDHKFDPLTQRDFYRLAAFFSNIDEHGLYSHFTETAPTPARPLYEGDEESRLTELRGAIRTQEELLQQIRASAEAEGFGKSATEAAEVVPDAQFTFDDLKPSGDYGPVPGHTGQAVVFGGDDALVLPDAGAFSRVSPFTFSLWIKPGAHRAREIVLHRAVAAEDAGYRGYQLVLDNGHAAFSLIHFWPGDALRVQTDQVLPVGEWSHVAITYDGSSRAAGVKLYLNGEPAATSVLHDSLTHDIVYRSDKGDSGSPSLSLGARFRDVGFRGGAVDDVLVFNRELTWLEIAPLADADRPTDAVSRFEYALARHHAEYQAAVQQLDALRKEENELVSSVRQIMVLKELPQPRPTYVLERGAYDSPGEQVTAGTPASLPALDANSPTNRLALARWMIDDENPLVSRVAVNRFWQMFFGQGLVASSSDFGNQGEPPSHPELLDWLARYFMDHDWDVKQLCKEIVLSATYRQASTPDDPQAYAIDPDNRLLARGPRHRLAAEQIRDNALAASGLLVPKFGGPSVFPYQPAGLWEEAGTGKSYTPSKGEGLYRRSLYTFWRRTSPPPTMVAFDAPSREFCTARRERTATPLQALALLNDPQFVEAARVLAERLIKEHGTSLPARIHAAFRLLTSRAPSDAEQQILNQLYNEQLELFRNAPADAVAYLDVGEAPRDKQLDAADHAAMTVLVETLFSHDESVTKR